MLTRLQVSGFKNLVDVDVYFGPFTCIAGANGVGKSNLFDAIGFLSALADRTLIDAALSVRDGTSDIRNIFHHGGNSYHQEMSFVAEMIIPATGLDDLGQKAKASITFLRYAVKIAYRSGDSLRSLGGLELIEEKLEHINLGDAYERLPFEHSLSWRKSAVEGRRASSFISTEGTGAGRVIKLHQDGRQGRPLTRAAVTLPRTVLSAANAAESPTALLTRREMQSWRLLQLEPSSLRKPDEFTAPTRLGMDGSHLPATLYYLARQGTNDLLPNPSIDAQLDDLHRQPTSSDMSRIYGQVANRLAELIDDVREVQIDRDDRRELLTLMITDRYGTTHPAQALSDGTLRFLALAVLDLEPTAQGLICLEEPENGIHPERIPAMLKLLQDIAVDANEEIGPDNPLRQVIVNTHSPSVVKQAPDDSLIVADQQLFRRDDRLFRGVRFSGLPNTWRPLKTGNGDSVPRGMLLAYLNPDIPEIEGSNGHHRTHSHSVRRPKTKVRVMDRPDMQQLMFPFSQKLE